MPFAVIFEVTPKSVEAYLTHAKSLLSELQTIPGFESNIRYASLTREDTRLSLSTWANEKALVKWRTRAKHHLVQEKGRGELLSDYHLRVGDVVRDSKSGGDENAQGGGVRFDETEVGKGTFATLIELKTSPFWVKANKNVPGYIAREMGLRVAEEPVNLVEWDVFEAVLTPGDLIVVATWRDGEAARKFEKEANVHDETRVRTVRIVRDYGMFDRREAPQYYPDAIGRETIHAV